MLTLGWSSVAPVVPAQEYLAVLSVLVVRRAREIPRLLMGVLAIRAQLRTAAGLMGYALQAQCLDKTFWTLSVWDQQESLTAFVNGDPHRCVMRDLAEHLRQARFATWSVRGDEVPLTVARERWRFEPAR